MPWPSRERQGHEHGLAETVLQFFIGTRQGVGGRGNAEEVGIGWVLGVLVHRIKYLRSSLKILDRILS